MLVAVRGAISVSEDSPQAIQSAVKQLVDAIMERNHIVADQILSVFFTVTPDLTALNPASAARKVRPDWQALPLLCSQEPHIEGMLPRCIRILLQWAPNSLTKPVCPVYLGDAQQLRPELA